MIEKAIILSAGQGKRLLPLTEHRPKCLLSFSGRTVIEWQIAGLIENGIRDITIVTGFHAEVVDAFLMTHPFDGAHVQTLFNPFFEVADNVGSCYLARETMEQGPFVLLNGDTMFHPRLMAEAMAQARGPITVTVDRKERYDADDMKVCCPKDRLLGIGKDLPEDKTDAESIGMIFFSAEGGKLFASALEKVLHDPAGLKRWYLSVIDMLAKDVSVSVAPITGHEWCEVDYPKDMAAAGALASKLLRKQMASTGVRVPPVRTGRIV